MRTRGDFSLIPYHMRLMHSDVEYGQVGQLNREQQYRQYEFAHQPEGIY